jgi:hypothetical protein
MRDKHYEPGNNLRKDIEVCLTGAGHLYDAKTAQLEITERFIGSGLSLWAFQSKVLSHKLKI